MHTEPYPIKLLKENFGTEEKYQKNIIKYLLQILIKVILLECSNKLQSLDIAK